MHDAERKSVLVVDDEPGQRLMLTAVLRDGGWDARAEADGNAALLALDDFAPRTALVDMRMPGMDGMELMARLKAARPHMPVVMLTAFGTVGAAVEAMKKGAFDYLTKPVDNEELKAVMGKALEYARLLDENQRLKRDARRDFGLIGSSPGMLQVKELIAQAGPSEANILILGESGTGKELVAEGLHLAGPRREGPLVKVNCAALPHDLLESELFGYVKGAFTGAVKDKPGRFVLASGGTLFLDEIGEMPPALQAKLLRALQDKAVEPLGGTRPVPANARIVSATNRDIPAEAAAGRFREDLFFRLGVLEIRIPPLRERTGDIPELAAFLLDKLGRKNNKPVRNVSPAFLDALTRHAWPGNVRELENVLERALILARSDTLGPELLPPQFAGKAKPPPQNEDSATPDLEETERRAIVKALEANNGHREKTADALGISRRTLQYKLKKYGLAGKTTR